MMSKLCRPCTIIILALLLCGGGYFAYITWAFPVVKCEAAKHLEPKQGMEGDCYGCHVKATPKVAQEWYESKHGVTLVRCQTCHGQPDGKGSIPFAQKPGVEVCQSCHGPAIERMEAKFGKRDDCATCHLAHQSPIHGKAYLFRQATTKTTLDEEK